MELFTAIALLCQVASIDKGGLTSFPYTYTDGRQLACQQSYVHCFNVKAAKGSMSDREVMTQCIMERK